MRLTYVVYSLTSMLTARFLLNLQETKHRLENGSQSQEEVSDVVFQPYAVRDSDGFMRSLGAQISFYHDDVPGELEKL